MAPVIDRLIRDILTSRVYEVARETPLDAAPRLSARLGNEVLLKREDLQPTFSFKIRGAYNRISRLAADERARGVVAASAGNHAQGVALSARRLGIRAVIVMPRTTPEIKIESVRNLGADVVLIGDHYAEAQRHAEALAADAGAVFIHPFDDPLVIAGQGTVAVEMLRQCAHDLTAIFVPVGGGGLIAGISAYVKALTPATRVIGVEPVDADAMARSLAAGERVRLPHVGMFADGVAVQQVGVHTFPIAQHAVDDVVRVDNDEICAAIKDIFDDTRTIMEPAGALALAGLKSEVARSGVRGGRFAAVLSGANMNFDRLRFVAERAELGEGREALLGVTIPERPGAFGQFCRALGNVVITEFNYRLSGRSAAQIFVGIQIASRAGREQLVSQLRGLDYDTTDLTDNEMAKLHVRHMVGGRTPHVESERVCRFEFPERPGALMQFLDALGGRWNISLFHYRNHGADFGRVLAAFEVPDTDRARFEEFLTALGYDAQLDEENDAYRRFLR
ncbi:MAG TPA: threonine ammonia-lyase, biosynthetic [Vicinamibacterales bacterium]|nr:threonine ammonia-lyase, biosynthetic [Vicinamibacterales bacterium]